MNKRNAFIIVGVLVTLIAIALLIIIPKYQEKKLIERLSLKTKEIVSAWGTFEDESSDQYLNSLKPYLSNSLFDQYQNDAISLREMNKGYEGTVDSEINIREVLFKRSRDDQYFFEVSAVKASKIINEKKDEVINITWGKEDNRWKVFEITELKK